MNTENRININAVERIVSVGVGALLLRNSFKRFNPLVMLPSVYLIYRGVSGRCLLYEALEVNTNETHNINIRSSFIINKPREELYKYWRNLANLPTFMEHLKSVTVHDNNRSTWIAELPGSHREITWDAEIVKDEPNKLIGWQSLTNPFISSAGKVVFKDAPKNQGTELTVVFSYRPPSGIVGEGMAKLLNRSFAHMIRNEVRRFRQMMETGEG
ncbi:SRPBCC family protein [Olivibacter sp. XZL3]|uniref:SRPBCC family protein n=1 Tax=Olivibacter sp. XZL3 TaxID=1735116 RepID=UPI0014170DBA|nr:SRPBCC family protein [Olivibacter sp. XZL3]